MQVFVFVVQPGFAQLVVDVQVVTDPAFVGLQYLFSRQSAEAEAPEAQNLPL